MIDALATLSNNNILIVCTLEFVFSQSIFFPRGFIDKITLKVVGSKTFKWNNYSLFQNNLF